MKTTIYSLLAAAACGMAFGQTAYTTPVGYVTQTLPANSDSILSLPVRKSAVAASAVSGAPDTTTIPGSAILTMSGTPGYTVNAFQNTHYAKFTSGTDLGKYFVITANAADTLTVNLNGAILNAVSTDTLEVIKFWTLNELFSPTASTTDPLTTGNAIVASTSTLAAGRRTSLFVPDLTSPGSNLAPSATYYVHGGLWKKQGQGNTDFGATQLWPDIYFIIRHPSTVTAATTYTASGEVETKQFDIALRTQAAIAQDNFIGLPRPVDITLNALNLANTSAFLTSTSTLAAGRRDQIFVYDNAVISQNKSPAATYYYHAGLWKKQGQGNTDFGTDVIKAGAGVIIRKYQSGTGATANWDNNPTY